MWQVGRGVRGWWSVWGALRLLCFFFNDTATTEIYPLSLHDALPICLRYGTFNPATGAPTRNPMPYLGSGERSEERFSRNAETDLVCRLLLAKNKTFERYLLDVHIIEVAGVLALRYLFMQ